MLIVPQYLPREARGAFVHVEKGAEHKAAHIVVSGTGRPRSARTGTTPRWASSRKTRSRPRFTAGGAPLRAPPGGEDDKTTGV